MLLGKRVLVLKDVGNHYHFDVLCPLVQDPASEKLYTMETVTSIVGNRIRVEYNDRYYLPCSCVSKYRA